MTRSEGAIPVDRMPFHRTRTTEYLAREILRNEGCLVLRSIDPCSLINLVAWAPGRGLLLIRVTTTRRAISGAAEIAALWKDEIDILRALPVPSGGSVHLWSYTDRKAWHRYQVLPGGLVEMDL